MSASKKVKIISSRLEVSSDLIEKFGYDFLKNLIVSKGSMKGVTGLTEDLKLMFPGDVLFELKATTGFPLDFALDKIINERGMAVDWPAFIEAARKNKRWDYQTYDDICHAMIDAMLPKEMQEAIKLRFQRYVLQYPHPDMKD